MYKLVGVQFEALPSTSREALFCQMTKLTSYMKGKDSNYRVDISKNRESYRLPLDPNLPADVEIEAWVFTEELNRFVKMRLKDISIGGMAFIPPFPDLKKKFEQGSTIKVVLRFGKVEISLDARVKNYSKIDTSKGQRIFLKNFLNDTLYLRDKKGPIESLFTKEQSDLKSKEPSVEVPPLVQNEDEWIVINVS
jgi:hypothetical protein